jgi:hypothetical protein
MAVAHLFSFWYLYWVQWAQMQWARSWVLQWCVPTKGKEKTDHFFLWACGGGGCCHHSGMGWWGLLSSFRHGVVVAAVII